MAIQCGHSNCAMYILSVVQKQHDSLFNNTALIQEGDRFLSNTVVPYLLLSLVTHNESLRSKVEPLYLGLKEEAEQQQAIQEKRAKSFMRYFW